MRAIPWTYDPRPDSRTTNVRLGIWLFLASEAMFFGSLFSAFVLLRTGAERWPDAGAILDLRLALVNTALLAAAALLLPGNGTGSRGLSLSSSAAAGLVFLGVKLFEYQSKLEAGLHPATNLLLGCWFTLTAVHALHVAAGVAANAWLAARARQMPQAQWRERLHATRLYWIFVDTVWIAVLVSFYFI